MIRQSRMFLLLSCLVSSPVAQALPFDFNGKGDQSWGVGSDGFRQPGDTSGIFWTLTDRGPNLDCEDSQKLLGRSVCEEGKIFPEPDFVPSIIQWQLVSGQDPVVLQVLPLRDSKGQVISGLSNPWTQVSTETAYDVNGALLPHDVNGLDPEGLVQMPDGSFWISDEYGPSLVKVSALGVIQERWVPAGMEGDLKDAAYPVKGKLPAILAKRKLNRGMESLTLMPSGRQLLVAMQSALENPLPATAKSSPVVRFLTVDLETETVDGLYVYSFDDASSFEEGGKKAKNGDLKISAITYRGSELLVQERTDTMVKIFSVQLGANLIDDAAAFASESPTLEEAPRALASKKLLWDSRSLPKALPTKIESMIPWEDNQLLLINDNDFGVTGAASEGLFIQMNP